MYRGEVWAEDSAKEELGGCELAGWSEADGAVWFWGSSSARTKIAGMPLGRVGTQQPSAICCTRATSGGCHMRPNSSKEKASMGIAVLSVPGPFRSSQAFGSTEEAVAISVGSSRNLSASQVPSYKGCKLVDAVGWRTE